MKEILPWVQVALAFGIVPLIGILWKLAIKVEKLPTETALIISNLKAELYKDFVTTEQLNAIVTDDRKVIPMRRARPRNGN